jgi:hypothetical protein
MIEIIKELNIEVSKPNVFQAVVAKQYDMNTRFIKATFVDGGDKITIDHTSTVKVVINALRPDGESRGFEGEVNNDGTVTVPLHSWMLEQVGTVTCDISFIDIETDDNKKLTTTSFTLYVEKAAFGGSDITTDPQYDVIVELLETCSTASIVAQEALDKSNEANAKYEACVEATENASAATEELGAIKEELAEGGYITGIREKNHGKILGFWVGTKEEYDALAEPPKNSYVIISDDDTLETVMTELEWLRSRSTDHYLLEQAGTDGCYWARWSDGTIKLKGKFNFVGAITYEYGSVFFSDLLTISMTDVFPPFVAGYLKSIFDVSININNTNQLLGVNLVSYENNELKFYVFSHTIQEEPITATVTFDLLGRWK